MHIVSVCTVYPGPGSPVSGLFSQRRLAALQAHAEVRVIHLRPWFPLLRPCPAGALRPVAYEAPAALRRRMFYVPGVLKSLDGWWLKRATLPLLRQMGQAGQLDIIDAQFGHPEGVGCVQVGLALRKPVFITVHGLEPWVLESGGRRARHLLAALHGCAGIISVSHSLQAALVGHGIEARKIRVIANAVGRGQFHPMAQAEARKRLGLPEDGRLIVCVGRFDREKGQDRLVRAVSRLRKNHSDLRLALIGERDVHDRSYFDLVRHLIAELGLAEVVLMPGPQSPQRVAEWMNAADLFALATAHEARSCVILEALACGTPVVSTPVGDNLVLVDPPNRGLLAPPQDEPALAAALEAALSRTWDRSAISAWGRDYGWDSVALQTLQFIRERTAVLQE